jgi:arylsulfatase A-like enzyme
MHARHYFANVTSVDKYIGEVIDYLQEIGELDNTIIIVSSDHGEMLGSHGQQGKNLPELESYAIPFIVHWPNKLHSGITDVLFGVPDVLPTIMGLAGLGNKIPNEVEGNDFSELIKNEASNTTVKKPEAVLFMLSKYRGVITNRYALYLKKQNTEDFSNLEDISIENGFLYDNVADPYQVNKIRLKDKPIVAKDLFIQLGKLLKKTNDPWYQKKLYGEFIPY